MNDSLIKKNIVVSLLVKPICLVLSLMYTAIVLSYLGETKYGSWVIVQNIISWINYFDVGIGNGLRNHLSEAYAKKKDKVSQALVSTASFAVTIVAVVFFIMLITIWNIFDLSIVFRMNIENENINYVIYISVFFVCVNFVLSLAKTIFYAIQLPGITSVSSMVGQMMQVIALWLTGKRGTVSLLLVAFLYGLISLAENIFLIILILKKYPNLRPRIRLIDKTYLNAIVSLGAGFFAIQICTLVLNATDNLIISTIFGSAAVTPYDVAYKFFYIFVQVHAIIIMPMWSAYTVASVQNDMKWIKKTIRKINIITVFLMLGIVVARFIFEPFSVFWLKKSLAYENKMITLIALYMILQMFGNNYSAVLCGIGEIKVSIILSVIEAFTNIPLSVWFAKTMNMGVSGVILGSVCMMLLNASVLPFVTQKWLRKRCLNESNN